MSLEVIILAAGEGKRMRSRLPKVLHQLGGEPLLAHVLRTAESLGPDRIHVVHGHGGDRVRDAFEGEAVNWIYQAEQNGTGHAVQCALPDVGDEPEKQILVLYGDVPLISSESLEALCEAGRDTLALLTVRLADPSGYGRIIRQDGNPRAPVVRIVEEKDATESERRETEVNTGFVAAPARKLGEWLSSVGDDNAQGERYLTDVVAIAVRDGTEIRDIQATDPWDVAGVNDRSQLALVEREYQKRRALALAYHGTTVLDPHRLDIRGKVDAGPDCVIDVNVVLEGVVKLGSNVRVGANCCLTNVRIADDVTIKPSSVIEDAVIGSGAMIGPFARIRPGTQISDDAHVGNFVELKNAELARGAKVNHLSYIGDSRVGERSNVGAGTITCNYDGAGKHHTEIGDDAFIGSNSQLVAPVRIGNGATVGAGSTITQDVPDGSLAVGRARQRNIKGWERPKKK